MVLYFLVVFKCYLLVMLVCGLMYFLGEDLFDIVKIKLELVCKFLNMRYFFLSMFFV